MAELKNLIVNGVARVNGDLYVSDNIYGTASNAISAAYAPFTNTDRYVNTASFASTGSNGANGVKMTLTRAGADTATVVATIPVAGTTAAGVVTGAQVTAWNGKQAAISDLNTIRTNAASGNVAFGWGNHANAGYLKGVVPIANGGTGQTTSLAAINGFLTSLPSWSANPTDATFLIRQDTGGANSFGRVTFGTVWNYVNGKTITSASRAVSAASADSATVATGLGVAANTSASVAAAINAKWTYNENTIKAVKVNNATAADSATSATTATKLAGTSGSTTTPVWINGGVPTACGGTVITDAERKSWVTASNQAAAANDGLTTKLIVDDQGGQALQISVNPGEFYVVSENTNVQDLTIEILEDTETTYSPEATYGDGVSKKLHIWGGIFYISNGGSVTFTADMTNNFIWSENSVDVSEAGAYEFNIVQYSYGGPKYGIITKYSES